MNNKNVEYKYNNKIQKPGKFYKFLLSFFIVIDVFLLLLAALGIFMNDKIIALAFGGLGLFLLAIVLFLKRTYNTSYQENADCFILKTKNKEYHVFYENIIDWQPSLNELTVLDNTRSDNKYVRVNMKFFKPEILLRKIVEMTFNGKFSTSNPEDPNREVETVNYLVNNRYGYLIEDYLEKLKNKHHS